MRQRLVHLLSSDDRHDRFSEAALRVFWSLRRGPASSNALVAGGRPLQAQVIDLARWVSARRRVVALEGLRGRGPARSRER